MIELIASVLITLSIYLILERQLYRKIFGIIVLSMTINLIILICGRLHPQSPAFIGSNIAALFSNPLPQAMILTAIVIGFALLAFLCVIAKVLHQSKSTQQGPQ